MSSDYFYRVYRDGNEITVACYRGRVGKTGFCNKRYKRSLLAILGIWEEADVLDRYVKADKWGRSQIRYAAAYERLE